MAVNEGSHNSSYVAQSPAAMLSSSRWVRASSSSAVGSGMGPSLLLIAPPPPEPEQKFPPKDDAEEEHRHDQSPERALNCEDAEDGEEEQQDGVLEGFRGHAPPLRPPTSQPVRHKEEQEKH